MSILSWFFKSKKQMAKPNTPRVRIGKYKVSSHAQNRMADPKRNLRKRDMVQNLCGRSIQSDTYLHKDKQTIQYDRLNKRNQTVTYIVKKDNVVKTIRKYHKKDEQKELEKLGGKRNGKK